MPISEAQEETAEGTKRETQQVLRDLIEMTEQIDNGNLMNFSMRKSFVYYDVSNILCVN